METMEQVVERAEVRRRKHNRVGLVVEWVLAFGFFWALTKSVLLAAVFATILLAAGF